LWLGSKSVGASVAVATAILAGLVERFVRLDDAAIEFLSVDARDRGLRLGVVAHLDETKAFGSAAGAVHNDTGRLDVSEGLETLSQGVIGRGVAQISDIDLFAHSGIPLSRFSRGSALVGAGESWSTIAYMRQTRMAIKPGARPRLIWKALGFSVWRLLFGRVREREQAVKSGGNVVSSISLPMIIQHL